MSNYNFEYIQLVRKSDMKEVYSSPAYRKGNSEVYYDIYDFEKIIERLKYYFSRINEGISQQLNSPKTPDNVKNTLKLISPSDYLIRSTICTTPGIHKKTIFWSKEAAKFLV